MTSKQMTKTHIEHPEDTILCGDLAVIDSLYNPAHVSMKMMVCH